MTPIERAARVLARREYPEQPDAWIDENWPEWLGDVRAVLLAIREPSKAQLSAARNHVDDWDRALVDFESTQIYQAMIDEALKEAE